MRTFCFKVEAIIKQRLTAKLWSTTYNSMFSSTKVFDIGSVRCLEGKSLTLGSGGSRSGGMLSYPSHLRVLHGLKPCHASPLLHMQLQSQVQPCVRVTRHAAHFWSKEAEDSPVAQHEPVGMSAGEDGQLSVHWALHQGLQDCTPRSAQPSSKYPAEAQPSVSVQLHC